MPTTTPFAQLSGSISQPPIAIAPCGFLPHVGADWSLLPGSEAGELANLSAILRTVCLQEETVWSMCRWTSNWPEHLDANRMRRDAALAPSSNTSGETLRLTEAVAYPDDVSGQVSSDHEQSPRIAHIAGISALAGVTLLAWLAVAVLSYCVITGDNATTPPADLAPQPAPNATATTPESQPAMSAAAVHSKIVTPKHLGMRQIVHRDHRFNTQSASSHPSRVTQAAEVSASHSRPHRTAWMAAHRGLSAWPSSALASQQSMFADATPRPTSAVLRADATTPVTRTDGNDTDWMQHVSQRRITEVAGEFAN